MGKEILRKVGKILFRIIKILLIPLIVFILLLLLLAGFVYFITVDDGTYSEDDWASPGFGVVQNVRSATISKEDGALSTKNTAQELWDKMIEENSRVDEYLDGPEELAKLMNAEIVTQYPDTRKNPEEEINWNQILSADSNKLQGIIKLKRNLTTGFTVLTEEELANMQTDYETYTDEYQLKKEEEQKKNEENGEEENQEQQEESTTTEGMLSFNDWMKNKGYSQNDNGQWQRQGEEITLTYIPPEEFEEKMQAYRNSGSEADKIEAMKYFTLEKSNAPDGSATIDGVESLDNVLFIGDSNTVRLESGLYLNDENKKKIEKSLFAAEVGVSAQYWIDNINTLPGNNSVDAVCVLLGVNNPDSSQMKTLIDQLCDRYPNKNIYIQKVFPVGQTYGNTTDSLNSSISNYNSEIKNYCSQKENVYFIDTTEGYVTSDGYLDPDMSEYDGLHFKDCNKWLENIADAIISVADVGVQVDDEENNDDSTEEENKDEDSEEKEEETSSSTEFSREPDFTNSEAWRHPYNGYQYGQCTWFAAGRFYEIYGLDPNGMGDGYQWVDNIVNKYGDQFEKTTTPVTGSIFSGDAAHNHVGIVIDVQGDQITIQEGNLNPGNGNYGTDPWEWAIIECTNGQVEDAANGDWWERTVTIEQLRESYGDVTFASPKNAISEISTLSERAGTQYYIKVATWSESSQLYTTADEESGIHTNPTVYEMTATKINYYDMVKAYTMPFDYLWALMVITEDKDFVFGLADLVYNSDIVITINDNLTETTTTQEYTYQKQEVISSTITLEDDSKENITQSRLTDFTATLTTLAERNTIEAGLTRANTWIVDYTKDYIYQVPEEKDEDQVQRDATEKNEVMSAEYERSDNTEDPWGLRANAEEEGKRVKGIYNQYKSANINWKETTSVHIKTTKYLGSTPNIREKTSKLLKEEEPEKDDTNDKTEENTKEDEFKYKEKNFITLLLSNKKAKSNILNVSSWLFEILEGTESTSDMFVDLTKYLLYKTTEKDIYEVNNFDFSIFSPGAFNSVSDIQGGNAQEMVWYALRSAGYSEIATAAVMGNIENESGFRADAIESGNGIGLGLCQWSFGRRTSLESYISSKGTDTSDIKTQIEFLLGELNPAGGADGYAKFQMSGNSSSAYNGISYTYNDWKDATDIEDATWAFMALFESPSYDPGTNHIDRRIADSKKYYEMYSGRDLDSFKKAEDDSKEASED